MQIEMKILDKKFYHVDKLGDWYYDTPTYQTSGSAAIDLVATKDYTIAPGEQTAIHTGLAIHIGSGLSRSDTPYIGEGTNQHMGVSFAGIILPRSGLGTKGLVLANTIGLIDEDYQGEIIVRAWNRNLIQAVNSMFTGPIIDIKAGDRFAQLMFVPVIKPKFKIVEEFTTHTERNTGSFGSTGL